MFDYQRKMESSDGDFVENLRDSSPSVDLFGDGDGEREIYIYNSLKFYKSP